jgi:3-phosphoglycerate kinase
MGSYSNRIVSGLIVVTIGLNQVLFAYAGERSFWEERRREQPRRPGHASVGLLALATRPILPAPEKLAAQTGPTTPTILPQGLDESYRRFFSAVPLPSAAIRKISFPPTQPPKGLVFHIQDVHRNKEAQTHIANVVSSLIKEPTRSSAIALVGLEGAFRPFSLTWLRSFPDPHAARLAGEELLAQDRLSGPMLSLLTASHPIPSVVGIDDPVHYASNVDAYRRSLHSKSAVQARLAGDKKSLDDEKSRTFNPDLLAFDKRVQDYERGLSSLGSYAHTLTRKTGPPMGHSLDLFLRALQREETLDFKQVETERSRLLETLSLKLDQTQTNDLIAQSLAYRAGQISYGDFYRWIIALCQRSGVSLNNYPAMDAYVQYVLLAESINAETLFQECRKREKEIYALLAKNENERKVVERSRRLSLTTKLSNFSLTPEEWADYQILRAHWPTAPDLEPYEAFYREALIRDASMAHNFLSALKTLEGRDSRGNSPKVSILVTGGYHAPGLTKKLTDAGLAVVSLVPKIEKVDTSQGSAYLTVFAQEKTPLEKLFEGAKLFVADKPLSDPAAATFALGAAVATARTNQNLSGQIRTFLKEHFENVRVSWAGTLAELRVTYKGKDLVLYFDPTKPIGQRIRLDRSSDTWGSRIQDALNVSRFTSLAKEIPLFLSSTFGPALVLGIALSFGVGPWAIVAQVIAGIGAAQWKWPPFLKAHETSRKNWLARNAGKTEKDYVTDLRVRYWSIVLVSGIAAIGISLFFLGGPAIEFTESAWKTVALWTTSLFFGPFLYHGAQNFFGTLRFGPAYVAAMAESNTPPAVHDPQIRQPGDPWTKLTEIPKEFLKGQTVIVRTNLDDTQPSADDMRMVLSAKTIRYLMDAGAKIVLVTHRGRPRIGEDKDLTIDEIASELGYLLNTSIPVLQGEETSKGFRWLSQDNKKSIESLNDGEVVIIQNSRFDPRELSNESNDRLEMAHELADIVPDALFVLDGFPVAHRGNTASVDGLAQILPGVKGLWETIEEEQHDNFLARLDDPATRGKLTVLFGGGKLDKKTEISAFAREHLREGDTLVIAGKFRAQLMPEDLKTELESTGVKLIIAGENDGDSEDVFESFAARVKDAIAVSQTVFWEGPLGRYRNPNSSSNLIARYIKGWAEKDKNRKAFISGGSTSFLFKTANGWDEEARAKATGVTVSTGGGTSIAYFAQRGVLPGTKALRGFIPKKGKRRSIVKGVVDLMEDPTFWNRTLTDPPNKKFVFYFDQKTGAYEIYPRENFPGDLADDPNEEMTELFRIQHRVNVPWGAPVDQNGIPKTGHFFVTHVDHKPLVIVFPKDHSGMQVFEGYTEATREAMKKARFVIVHNPDRAKRPGAAYGQATREQAEADPNTRVISAESIRHSERLRLEMWLARETEKGRTYWGTANVAGYIPNDPTGNPDKQVDHLTYSRADKDIPQKELKSPEAIRDSLLTFFRQKVKSRDALRVTGNGWFYGDFKAGASQNILHNHLVRLIFVIENAKRLVTGKIGNITLGHIHDEEDARGLFFDIESEDDIPELTHILEKTYDIITAKGHSFNFIIAPKENRGARVFVGDKIAGVPVGIFKNESAFAEFGLVFINDDPSTVFDLSEEQIVALQDANVAEWVIKNWRNGSLKIRNDLEENCAKAIDLVSLSKEDYKKLAQQVLSEFSRPKISQADSLLSRILMEEGKKYPTSTGEKNWDGIRIINDFIAAPLYETALFFLLPAASGSLLLLGVGVLTFVALHFWDDYAGARASGLSPPNAFKKASLAAKPRLLRALVLYAAPFALFMIAPDFFQLFSDINITLPILASIENPLVKIAGVVAVLHAGRNIFNSFGPNREGRFFGRVLSGMTRNQEQAREIIKNVFPKADSLDLNNLGSPGLRRLEELGGNLNQPSYANRFSSSLGKFIKNNLSHVQIRPPQHRCWRACEPTPPPRDAPKERKTKPRWN